MYHRFNESKYPSTNIQLDIFKKQLDIIQNENIKFIHPNKFEESILDKSQKKNFINYRRWTSIFL